jgi:hypothetical protein
MGILDHVTDMAIKVSVREYEDDKGKVQKETDFGVWLPLSQIAIEDIDLNSAIGHEIEMEVPSWLMEDKGLV